jgi:lipocalin
MKNFLFVSLFLAALVFTTETTEKPDFDDVGTIVLSDIQNLEVDFLTPEGVKISNDLESKQTLEAAKEVAKNEIKISKKFCKVENQSANYRKSRSGEIRYLNGMKSKDKPTNFSLSLEKPPKYTS